MKTVYTLTIEPSIVRSEIRNASQSEVRYRLEERFSDFTTAKGLTLPSHYVIEYTEERQNGLTAVSQGDLAEKVIKQNVSPDPRNFQVRQQVINGDLPRINENCVQAGLEAGL